MRNILWTIFFGLIFSVSLINAQIPEQTPTRQQVMDAQIKQRQKTSRRTATPYEGILNPDTPNPGPVRPLPMGKAGLSKRDKELISIDIEDKNKYAAFLKQSDAGILRLHDSGNCDVRGKIVNAAEPCPWNVAGKATTYSFRTGDYASKFFSDLQFEEKTFKIVGINLLGFLTDLGDVSVENLNLQSRGIKEMAEFEPSTNADEITKHFSLAKNGFQVGDHIYKTDFSMNPNKTYAMRSIAYDTKVIRKIGKRKINVLGSDKRKDIIVIFRVIREHEDGSINILWKKIQSKDAPKLKLKK